MKIPKASVLYLEHPDKTDYTCAQCMMFIDDKERCTVHPKDEEIKALGSCGYWIGGKPATGKDPHGGVTAKDSGYTNSKEGFSCKRCIYFSKATKKCYIVEGSISPDGCCNHWKARK
jgi:hypothetical protein